MSTRTARCDLDAATPRSAARSAYIVHDVPPDVAPLPTPKQHLSHRVWAAVRAAGGDVSVAAKALGLPPREVLQMLLETPAPDADPAANSGDSGTRRRLLIDPVPLPEGVRGSRPVSTESGEPRAWETPAWEEDDDEA